MCESLTSRTDVSLSLSKLTWNNLQTFFVRLIKKFMEKCEICSRILMMGNGDGLIRGCKWDFNKSYLDDNKICGICATPNK